MKYLKLFEDIEEYSFLNIMLDNKELIKKVSKLRISIGMPRNIYKTFDILNKLIENDDSVWTILRPINDLDKFQKRVSALLLLRYLEEFTSKDITTSSMGFIFECYLAGLLGGEVNTDKISSTDILVPHKGSVKKCQLKYLDKNTLAFSAAGFKNYYESVDYCFFGIKLDKKVVIIQVDMGNRYIPYIWLYKIIHSTNADDIKIYNDLDEKFGLHLTNVINDVKNEDIDQNNNFLPNGITRRLSLKKTIKAEQLVKFAEFGDTYGFKKLIEIDFDKLSDTIKTTLYGLIGDINETYKSLDLLRNDVDNLIVGKKSIDIIYDEITKNTNRFKISITNLFSGIKTKFHIR